MADAPETVTRAIAVVDKAIADLDEVVSVGSSKVNPLDVLMDRLEGWKSVHRPVVAAQVGPAALTQFDHATDRVDVSQTSAVYNRLQQQFGPSSRDMEARLALAYREAFYATLVAIKADVEKYGDQYLQTGGRMSVDFVDTPLRDVLQALSRRSGVSLVPEPGVSLQAKITLKLNDVTWYQVLQVVARANGLLFEQDGNVIRLSAPAGVRKDGAAAAGAAVPAVPAALAGASAGFEAEATRGVAQIVLMLSRVLAIVVPIIGIVVAGMWSADRARPRYQPLLLLVVIVGVEAALAWALRNVPRQHPELGHAVDPKILAIVDRAVALGRTPLPIWITVLALLALAALR